MQSIQHASWLASLINTIVGLSFYGDRMDPWDTRHVKTLPQGDGTIIQVDVQYGGATAVQFNPQTQEVGTFEIARNDVIGLGFPDDALNAPVGEAEWKERCLWDGRPGKLPVDPACPRRGEGHLQKATVEVLEQIGSENLVHKAINIGGLYGEGTPDFADDPIVETLRWDPQMKVLCIDCGAWKSIERLDGHHDQVEISPLAGPPHTDFSHVPQEWRNVDVLRLESMPGGTSCKVLRSVLRVVRPTVVVLIVHGQIPPPVKFSILRDAGNSDATDTFYSCSVSAVADILEVFDISMLRLSGPYALFVRKDAWKSSQLPIDAVECFRHVEVWGVDLFPIEFVREWMFAPQILNTVARIHGNITSAFTSFGLQGEPFMLSI